MDQTHGTGAVFSWHSALKTGNHTFLYPKKDSTDRYPLKFSKKSDSHLGARESMARFSKRLSLYVKTSDFHSKNQTETLKGSRWKSENCPTLIITCGGASKSKYLSLIWLKNSTSKWSTEDNLCTLLWDGGIFQTLINCLKMLHSTLVSTFRWHTTRQLSDSSALSMTQEGMWTVHE